MSKTAKAVRRPVATAVAPRAARTLLTTLLPALCTAGGCAPPDYRAQVCARVEKLSFNNPGRPDELGRELADMSAGELAALCDLLVEPGAGDDTAARMALHGLALYAGQQATAEQRGRFVRTLCRALEGERPTAVKAFLIQQLQLGGDRRATPTLARLLNDEQLCADAAQALLAADRAGAGPALVKALRAARGRCRMAIVAALCEQPDHRAVRMLLDDAGSADEALRSGALAALAAIGDPAATDALRKAAAVQPWAERALATERLLLFAERLADRGYREPATQLLRELMQTHSDPGEAHVRCAALHGLARVRGAAAVADVVAALVADDPVLRAAALDVAAGIPGADVTEAYVGELAKAAPEARAGILKVLARRGDRRALPAAIGALRDPDGAVRLAAVAAVARLGQLDAVDPLVDFLSAAQADERRAAEDALTGLPGEAASRQIAGRLPRSPAGARAALLDVLARRGARSQLKTIYAFVRDENQDVRIRAIAAVGALADDSAAPTLLALLKQNEAEAVREALEAALASTCKRAAEAQRAAPVLAALDREHSRDYCSLLRVLGRIGGRAALAAIDEAARDQRLEVREAAIRALGDWPDPTPAEAELALSIARQSPELTHHVLALRAFARFFGLTAGDRLPEALEQFQAGMGAARRVEEKKLLLARLGEIRDAQVLPVLSGFLADEALRVEAASAIINVGRQIVPQGGWAPAREALEQVLAVVQDERVRQQAGELMKVVGEYEDYITDWMVAGPYLVEGKSGQEIVEVPFAPEQPEARDVVWKKHPAPAPPDAFYNVNLARSIGGSHRAAYLRAYVHAPEACDALLELGSDDSIRVWVNRELVHSNKVHRGCARGQDRVPARLKAGWNELLLKVINDDGGWAACLRVRAPDGSRLEGLKVAAEAP